MDAYGDILLAPLVVGLVEAIKRSFGLAERWAPILSITFGVGLKLVIDPGKLVEGVIVGIMIGLSASGLYSGSKATFAKE